MKRVQHKEIATRNECNTKKVQQEMSATHRKVQCEKSTIKKNYNTEQV